MSTTPTTYRYANFKQTNETSKQYALEMKALLTVMSNISEQPAILNQNVKAIQNKFSKPTM